MTMPGHHKHFKGKPHEPPEHCTHLFDSHGSVEVMELNAALRESHNLS